MVRHSIAVICIALAVLLAGPVFGRSQRPPVLVGADMLLGDAGSLKGTRIGLLTNRAGVTSSGEPTIKALAALPAVTLTALFAPEHGLEGTYGAGEPVPNRAHPSSRMSVYSLYGDTLVPTRQMLSHLDVIVVDLQDVGVRAYTYASTMALVMQAAQAAGKRVVILDRPNPLGGVTVDGPVLEPQLRSFIGMYQIPYVHGMTLGELAALYNRAFGINARLTVIPMKGWERTMVWEDTGLPWADPSPGLVDADIAPYFAATGPIDGTNLWNGGLTDARFRVVLAPWIDAPRLAERLNRFALPGVHFTPSAVPHPRTGVVWQGLRLRVTEPHTFRPATTAIYILAEIRRLHGGRLVFQRSRSGNYEFDRVWGTKNVRLALQRGEPAMRIVAAWQPGLERFKKLRQDYLLYK